MFAEKGGSGCGFQPEVHPQTEETTEAGPETEDHSLPLMCGVMCVLQDRTRVSTPNDLFFLPTHD